MATKMISSVLILAIISLSRIDCIPQLQQQSGISAAGRQTLNLDTTTPVPIVAQSDVKNDDGSFNYR